jgi:hypothetical protein
MTHPRRSQYSFSPLDVLLVLNSMVCFLYHWFAA